MNLSGDTPVSQFHDVGLDGLRLLSHRAQTLRNISPVIVGANNRLEAADFGLCLRRYTEQIDRDDVVEHVP